MFSIGYVEFVDIISLSQQFMQIQMSTVCHFYPITLFHQSTSHYFLVCDCEDTAMCDKYISDLPTVFTAKGHDRQFTHCIARVNRPCASSWCNTNESHPTLFHNTAETQRPQTRQIMCLMKIRLLLTQYFHHFFETDFLKSFRQSKIQLSPVDEHTRTDYTFWPLALST